MKEHEQYLKLGWSVLPMKFIQAEDGKMVKKPMVEWKRYQSEQPQMSVVDSWIGQGWFLGLITGKLSGIVVVDDDRAKHGLKEANLTSSVIARTKSGGKHYYFRYDRPVSNHANSDIHVDIRGEGGYVVLPPYNGYEWVSPPTPENLALLQTLPQHIEDKIAGDRRMGDRVTLSDYEQINAGERNSTLHRIACAIWNNDRLTEEDKITNIEAFNLKCNPPLGAYELEAIINSAKKFVENNPKKKQDEPVKPAKFVSLSEAISSHLADKEMSKDCPSTGLSGLDKMVKGFIPNHLYILSGDTNVGKTSSACYFAVSVASQGKSVLYVSLEPDVDVVGYMASVLHDKPFATLNASDFEALKNLNIDILLKDSVKTASALTEILKSTPNHYDLVVIDHIGYFITDTANTNQAQSNLMKELADMPRKKKCAVMAIAHLRKREKGKKKGPPTADDLSGSAALKQDATDVWLLWREGVDGDKTNSMVSNTGYLIVAKSKNSASGAINILFRPGYAGIKEYVSDPFYAESRSFINKTEKDAVEVFK